MIICNAPAFPHTGACLLNCSLNSRDYDAEPVHFHYYRTLVLQSVSPPEGTKLLPQRITLRIQGMIRTECCMLRLVFPVLNADGPECIRGPPMRIQQHEQDVELISVVLPRVQVYPNTDIMVPYLAAIRMRELFFEVALDGQHFSAVEGNILSPHMLQLFDAPVVTKVEPAEGPTLGNTIITLNGFEFHNTGDIKVRFVSLTNPNDHKTVPAEFHNPRQICCTTPDWDFSEAGGNVYMEVSQLENQFVRVGETDQELSAEIPTAFVYRYYKIPMLASLDYQVGPSSGNTRIAIRGSEFESDGLHRIYVRFGTQYTVPANFISSREIACITRSMKPGRYSVSLSLNGQQFFTKASQKFDRRGSLRLGIVDVAHIPESHENFAFFVYDPPILKPMRKITSTAGGGRVCIPGSGFVDSHSIVVRTNATGSRIV